ncbi:MAG: Phosphate transport system permease protein PstA 1 [Fimbriimonadaceae bacterium]|nr:Phosphate transport system permease protein PstA 1 [Fimbriimonadaceae bacterium]
MAQASFFESTSQYNRRKRKSALFGFVCAAAMALVLAVLILLLYILVRDGVSRVNLSFFTNFTSRIPENAGIKASLFGTLWIIGVASLFAVPIGIASAIYLEEYSRGRNRFVDFVKLNIANLAGVPSIVYGLLGLALFVRWMSLDRSILSGGLTMGLLILPVVIIVSQESLRAVPRSFREGAYALGATQWQVIAKQVLPNALPGILTGIILAVSRAIGETAPLIAIGAVSYIAEVPSGVRDRFTVLPIQIFDWTSRPQQGFHEAAAAGIVVLLGVLVSFNLVAILIRYRQRKRLGR